AHLIYVGGPVPEQTLIHELLHVILRKERYPDARYAAGCVVSKGDEMYAGACSTCSRTRSTTRWSIAGWLPTTRWTWPPTTGLLSDGNWRGWPTSRVGSRTTGTC